MVAAVMALAVTGAAGADDFHGARVTFAGTQSNVYPNHTPIDFTGSEELDTDAYHDPSTNPSRLTVPTGLGGIYLWHGEVCFTTQSSNDRIVRLRANGSSVFATNSGHPGDQIACYTVTGIRSHTAGDYVEVTAFNTYGTLNVVSATLEGTLLNPADAGGGGGGALDDLTDVDLTGYGDGDVLKYSTAETMWVAGTDVAGEGGSGGTVTLSAGDRERLDLNWWGIWALVGLVLVLMIAAPMLSVMRVTRGMADGRG